MRNCFKDDSIFSISQEKMKFKRAEHPFVNGKKNVTGLFSLAKVKVKCYKIEISKTLRNNISLLYNIIF